MSKEAVAKNALSIEGDKAVFVTVNVADQWFGIPVLEVQDVLGRQRIAKVPLAPPEVAGSLNLRGRIVTAIDVRVRLGLPPLERPSGMSAVVRQGDDLYSLLVDHVGEVLSLPLGDYEKTPPTLDQRWQAISAGVYHLDQHLLVILDITRLLRVDDRTTSKAAVNSL